MNAEEYCRRIEHQAAAEAASEASEETEYRIVCDVCLKPIYTPYKHQKRHASCRRPIPSKRSGAKQVNVYLTKREQIMLQVLSEQFDASPSRVVGRALTALYSAWDRERE